RKAPHEGARPRKTARIGRKNVPGTPWRQAWSLPPGGPDRTGGEKWSGLDQGTGAAGGGGCTAGCGVPASLVAGLTGSVPGFTAGGAVLPLPALGAAAGADSADGGVSSGICGSVGSGLLSRRRKPAASVGGSTTTSDFCSSSAMYLVTSWL